MDEAREYLHRKERGPSFAGLLNWLSATAFGHPDRQDSWGVGRLLRGLLSSGPSRGRSSGGLLSNGDYPEEAKSLGALMLCPTASAAHVIARYPKVLQMDPADVAVRLTLLKSALPQCNVARMVELQPRLFLEEDLPSLCRQVSSAYGKLREGLPGADVAEMVQDDPGLLFLDLSVGIAELHDLWNVDEDALRASEPKELALAVRALAKLTPRRY